MSVDNLRPAPVIIPSTTITDASSGQVLEVFPMGDTSVPISNFNDGDGLSYVSEIQVCRENEASDTIVGLRFTNTNVQNGQKYE